MKTTCRHKIILLLLVVLFAAPGLSAYFLYFHPQWLSATTTNKGTLLNPPVLLPELKKKAKWQLILWSPIRCDQDCMQQFETLARIRLALGRRLYHVDLTLLQSAQAESSAIPVFDDPGVSAVRLSPSESMRVAAMYPQPQLFITNPDNYLVLAYPVTAAANDLYHDIKLLLAKGN